jgi:hypothetical protein
MIEPKPDLKSSILNILLSHKGKENAIIGKNLAQRLNQRDTRKIRLLIEELIADGYAICSTPHPPHGYFLAVSYQDVLEALKILRNGYALSLLHHYKNLKRAGFNTFSGQISMFKM